MKSTLKLATELYIMVTLDTNLKPLTKDGKDILKEYNQLPKLLKKYKNKNILNLYGCVSLFAKVGKTRQGYLFVVIKKAESKKLMPKDFRKLMLNLRIKTRSMVITSLSIDTDMIPLYKGDKTKITKLIEEENHDFITKISII